MPIPELRFREATASDVPELDRLHLRDGEPGDSRKALYLDGKHHPQHALSPRVVYLASHGDTIVGYIGGHLTERFGCDGELQYLFVSREHRRTRVASSLLRRLAGWFTEHDASQVCVDVAIDNAVARRFYASQGAVDLDPYWLVWNDIKEVLAQP